MVFNVPYHHGAGAQFQNDISHVGSLLRYRRKVNTSTGAAWVGMSVARSATCHTLVICVVKPVTMNALMPSKVKKITEATAGTQLVRHWCTDADESPTLTARHPSYVACACWYALFHTIGIRRAV